MAYFIAPSRASGSFRRRAQVVDVGLPEGDWTWQETLATATRPSTQEFKFDPVFAKYSRNAAAYSQDRLKELGTPLAKMVGVPITTYDFFESIEYPFYIGWIIYMRYFHEFSDVPGPFFASISRLWIGSSVAAGNAEVVQRDLHRELGPFVRIAPNEVSISDPSAIKVIYGAKSSFTKTDFYTPFSGKISSHGDHFTQRDEKKHAERRRFVNNVYSMSSVLESEEYIDACCSVFLEKMSKFAKEGKSVDFGEWIQWYTFDVVGEMFFGQQFGFMRNEHDYNHYIESLDTLLPGITLSCVLPSYVRTFNKTVGMLFPTVRASVKGFDAICAAGRYMATERETKMQSEKVGRVDLLDKFFKIRDDKEGFDIRDIQGEAATAIFAGSDTTAIAVRSIFYHLMKNPKHMSKLVAEIDDFAARGQISDPHITYAEAIKMPYLVACCKEGMRLHPSVGLGMPRHVPPGGATIAGRYFSAGSRVSMNAAVVQYDQSVFGEDASEFNPDRWLSGDGANMDRHMLHFGGGTRTCIGKNISLAEMHKLVPDFLRRFHVELVDQAKEWETHNFWFNKQLGINVRVKAR